MILDLHTTLTIIVLTILGINAANGQSNSALNCGQTNFTSDTGTINLVAPQSNGYKSCTYDIKTRNGTRIVLKWRSFLVDADMPVCRRSSVTVYVGCSSKRLINFCSKNTASLPHDIYTKDHCLKLVFTSFQDTKEAFSATYYSVDKNRKASTSNYCLRERKLFAKSGVIITPGWPTGYGPIGYDCQWDIEMPKHYSIKVSVMDMDMYEAYGVYKPGRCKSSDENLKIKREKSLTSKYIIKNYYCGEHSPFSMATQHYDVEIELETRGYRRSNRGFIVGYIAYQTSEPSTPTKPWVIVGYVFLGIVIFTIAMTAMICFCKRR